MSDGVGANGIRYQEATHSRTLRHALLVGTFAHRERHSREAQTFAPRRRQWVDCNGNASLE